MTESTFTFRVDEELKTAFAEAAKAQDRTAAQLLRALMRGVVERDEAARDYDVWFRAEVEEGIKEADDPNVRRIPHEEMMAKWDIRIEELRRRAASQSE